MTSLFFPKIRWYNLAHAVFLSSISGNKFLFFVVDFVDEGFPVSFTFSQELRRWVAPVNTYYATPICLMSLSRWNCKASVFRWIGSSIVWLNFSPLCIKFNSRSSNPCSILKSISSFWVSYQHYCIQCSLLQCSRHLSTPLVEDGICQWNSIYMSMPWCLVRWPVPSPTSYPVLSDKIFGYQTTKLWWSWGHELFLGLEANTAQPDFLSSFRR